MTLLTLLLQASPVGGNSGMMNILMIVAMVAIFYFFMIRPQTKRQKELQKARQAMKAGDRVITSGGVYGTIRDINTTTNEVILEVAEGVRIKIDFNNVFALPDTTQAKK